MCTYREWDRDHSPRTPPIDWRGVLSLLFVIAFLAAVLVIAMACEGAA